MLKYLKIFTWFLFTFGLVGAGATLLGVDVGLGESRLTVAAFSLQVVVAAAIMYGFKLARAGELSEKTLVYSGWAAIVALVVMGQILLNLG